MRGHYIILRDGEIDLGAKFKGDEEVRWDVGSQLPVEKDRGERLGL